MKSLTNSTGLKITPTSVLINSAHRSTSIFRTNADEVRNTVGEDGKDYLVAPVVAIKEGVLNGEKVTGKVIEDSTVHWNKVPVTANHPEVNGEFVGVKDPGVKDQVIGFLTNTSYSGNALHGEIWIDVALANSIGGEASEIVEKLQNGSPMDVSTGYLAEVMMVAGEFHGEHYQGEQTHIYPDHLAVLPNVKGACSWGDGCGTPRTNNPVTNKQTIPEGGKNSVKIREAFRMIGDKLGYSVKSKHNVEGMTFTCQHCSEEHTLTFQAYTGLMEFDLAAECPKTHDAIYVNQSIRVNGSQLGKMLDTMINDQKSTDVKRSDIISQMAEFAGTTAKKVKQVLAGDVTFVPRRWLSGFAQVLDVDLFDLYDAYGEDTANYRDENFDHAPAFSFFSKTEVDSEKLNECGCGVDKTNTDSAEIVNEDSNTEQETTNMVCPKVVEMATNLIENENSKFIEADRKYLESLELTRLETFVPVEDASTEETTAANTEVVTKTEVETAAGGTETKDVSANSDEEESTEEETVVKKPAEVEDHTIDALLSGISNAEHKSTLTEAYQFLNKARSDFITKITANSEFSAAELEGKKLGELRKLNSLIEVQATAEPKTPTPNTNYGLANGSRTNVDDDGTIPVVPILFAKAN